jgi:acetate kinase
MDGAILVLNAGSSSLKFSVYEPGNGSSPRLIVKGQIAGLGTSPTFSARDGAGKALPNGAGKPPALGGHGEALDFVAQWLRERFPRARLLAAGHRVVHGGPGYAKPVVVTDAILEALENLVPLAPLHQPHNLAPIRALRQRRPELPQVACFDTAFHRGHPAVADRYALPEPLHAAGIRRYGFHGLSYEYIARQLPRVAPGIAQGRVVVAHLGSGASMCALERCGSIDSTMGFTALDGLPMGTRCGAIDPGVLLYLMTEKGMDAKAIEHLLYYDSGLRGLSGVSNDVRELLQSASSPARFALDYFVYRINRELGALAAVLGGLDGLVFTAGIGENSPEIREHVCRKAAWLGIEIDDRANAAGATRISAPSSRASVWVIPTDEEAMVALHTVNLVGRNVVSA